MPQVIPFILGAVGITVPAAGTFASVLFQLASSVALSALSRALGPKPPQLIRELQVPTSRPPKRYAYGRARITGSWAPLRTKGLYIYGCMILNSRPSASITKLWMDKRDTLFSGDPHDFAGPGAVATAAPMAGFVNFWVGLGGQTAPPDDILAEAPELFNATDGWRGLTVAWFKINAGKNKTRAQRWPATPPDIAFEGDWSKVWDPRDVAQDAADPATWEWSDNQALCLLDALTQNPIRRYSVDQVLLSSLTDAADIADQAVALKAGGTEPRYRVGGLLVWDGSELIDQIRPLADAGGGRLVRVGGRLGYAPGAWQAPALTVTRIMADGGIDLQTLKPGRDMPTAIKAVHIAPDRDWQESELPAKAIPGAPGSASEDGVRELRLPFVTSATQAMRLQQIAARQAGAQRTLSVTLPPSAFAAVAGCVVTMNLPAPLTRLNGLWQVESADPGLWTSDTAGGVALRVPVTMVQTAEDHFAWVPATDEFDLVVETFDPDRNPVTAPGTVTLTASPIDLGSVGALAQRIRFSFAPVVGVADLYEWEIRQGLGDWTAGGSIDEDVRDGASQVFGLTGIVTVGLEYKIRVRVVSPLGASDWTESATFTAPAPPSMLPAPAPVSAIATGSEVVVTFRAPNVGGYLAGEIYAARVNDFAQAGRIAGPVYGPSNSLLSVTDVVGMVPAMFRNGADDWTGVAGGDPDLVGPPSGLITYPEVDGVGRIARFTDVSAATAIAIGSREVIAPVASRTYRLTVRARIFGATSLGSNQAQLIFQQMDALYVAGTASVTNVSFASDAWTELSATFSSATPPAFLRPRFIKRSTWSDATAQIDVEWLLLEDLTDGSTVYYWATSLDAFLSPSLPSASITETTTP